MDRAQQPANHNGNDDGHCTSPRSRPSPSRRVLAISRATVLAIGTAMGSASRGGRPSITTAGALLLQLAIEDPWRNPFAEVPGRHPPAYKSGNARAGRMRLAPELSAAVKNRGATAAPFPRP